MKFKDAATTVISVYKGKSWLKGEAAKSVDRILDNPGEAIKNARRVYEENPNTRSADCVPSRRRLSQLYDAGGIKNVPIRREHTGCRLSPHGEILCRHIGQPAPREDCRQAWCPHQRTMRMRLLGRLQQKYAPGRRTYGGR